MSKSAGAFYGIDVSKDSLSIAMWSDSPVVEDLPNTAKAIRSWLKRIAPSSSIGMESTNTYHLLVARLAHEAGHRVYVLQPRAVNSYAKSLQVRGKTDQMDAVVIARMVAKEGPELRVWEPPTPLQDLLRRLSNARGGLVKMRSSAKLMAQSYKEFEAVFEEIEKALENGIETLQQTINERIKEDRQMSGFNKRVQGVAGVGPVVGTLMSSLFHSYPLTSPDAAVAYIGFDPRPRESGKWQGQRRISKNGPSEARRCLFLAGRAAMNSKAWASYVGVQKRKGLSPTQIAIIMARKIIKIAWYMWRRTEMNFDPGRIQCAA